MQKFSFAKSVVIMVIYKYNSFLLLVIKMKGCVCVLKWLKCHFHPLFLLPNLAVLQITHEKYLNILHVPGHTTIFHRDVAHALFWCNQYEMEELLHWRLGTIVVSYLIFFSFFLSFCSFCFVHLQNVMLSTCGEIAFWMVGSFFWQLLHLKAARSFQPHRLHRLKRAICWITNNVLGLLAQ